MRRDISNAIQHNPKYVLTLHLKKKLFDSWINGEEDDPFENLIDLKDLCSQAIKQDAKFLNDLFKLSFIKGFDSQFINEFCDTLISQEPSNAYTTYMQFVQML